MRPIVPKILVVALLCFTASAASAQKKGGKDKDKAAPAASAPKGDGKGDDGEIELEDTATPDKAPAATPGDDGIELEDQPKEGDLETDQAAVGDAGTPTIKAGPVKKTPVSWKDILVVIRKPFLKVRRVELLPFAATTMNDNIIRHYSLGAQLNYYLTDVLAVGLEGQLYRSDPREPFDLIGRQARRLPTVNEYNWSAALNFHYVPVYGKFAVVDKHLVTWEVFFTAGLGAGQSSVIPRDVNYPGFDNFLIQLNAGAGMRFFLSKFITVTAGFRDYVFNDQFEPTNRSPTMNTTAAQAKDNADSSIVNNVMFQFGVSFWLPMSFEYTTFR
jgi:outer membrane beta-barrel protein